jgi:hypothetical protein
MSDEKIPERTPEDTEWQKQTMKAEKLSTCINALDAISRNRDMFSAEGLQKLMDPLVPKITKAIEDL